MKLSPKAVRALTIISECSGPISPAQFAEMYSMTTSLSAGLVSSMNGWLSRLATAGLLKKHKGKVTMFTITRFGKACLSAWDAKETQ